MIKIYEIEMDFGLGIEFTKDDFIKDCGISPQNILGLTVEHKNHNTDSRDGDLAKVGKLGTKRLSQGEYIKIYATSVEEVFFSWLIKGDEELAKHCRDVWHTDTEHEIPKDMEEIKVYTEPSVTIVETSEVPKMLQLLNDADVFLD